MVHSKFLGSNDNTRQSKILLSIIVMFVFCQCFTIIPDIYELNCFLSTENLLPQLFRFYDDDHQCQYYTYHLIEISHLMLAVNSSINFIFYTIHIKLFRENIMKVSPLWNLFLKRTSIRLIITIRSAYTTIKVSNSINST